MLGLLREKKGFAALLINEEGVALERARESIAEWQKKNGLSDDPKGLQTITIRGQEWKAAYIEAQVEGLKKFAWRKREWKPMDVLVENGTNKVCFDTNAPDESRFRLVPAGWTRDWCAICSWELSADGGDEHFSGYTNGRQWLCLECYDRFFAGKP